MFAPIFKGVKNALLSEPLLPRLDGGYVEAERACLGGTKALRDLFNPDQIATLFGQEGDLAWVSDDITRDRTRDLYHYLRKELKVQDIDPESTIRELNQAFLEEQTDDWILKLYDFLNGQTALQREWWFAALPLIRLEDGRHVPAKIDDDPQAFLPTKDQTDFPSVRESVCATKPTREFLKSLGLEEPTLVDDVIEHVLPKYAEDEINVSDEDYEDDIGRILDAFGTDSKEQSNRLVEELRKTRFVRAIDAGDGSKRFARSDELYLATERLKNLFEGVKNVLLIDDSKECLRGEKIRRLLSACGAARNLRLIEVNGMDRFTCAERKEMRRNEDYEPTREKIEDQTLRGIDELLAQFPSLHVDIRKEKAELFWYALRDFAKSQDTGVFVCTYRWFYHIPQSEERDSLFVEKLNKTDWVPDADGELHRPEFVSFDSLGWSEDPFLESKIRFRPRIVEELAEKMGIPFKKLELLKQLEELGGTEADLRNLIAQKTGASERKATDNGDAGGSATDGEGNGGSVASGSGTNDVGSVPSVGARNSTPKSASSREFISYVQVNSEEDDSDPDNLAHEARMNLEAKAIERILKHEPDWQRPQQSNNPGYDLYKVGESGEQARLLCEVKAMTGSLLDRPVGISRAQFDLAKEYGESYWLYVVEHAGDDEKARIVKIQDPVGKARTFTFARGWIEVAEVVEAGAVESDV